MSRNNFELKTLELEQALNRLPKKVKDIGLQFFKSRFRAQGWHDATFMPWKKRKGADKKGKGRAIMIKSGRLRNSLRGRVMGNDVIWGTDVPYAKVHNEGGEITRYARSELFVRNRSKKGKFKRGTTAGQGFTFKGSSRRMPQRQFMGDSQHLRKLVTRTIETTVKKVFQ